MTARDDLADNVQAAKASGNATRDGVDACQRHGGKGIRSQRHAEGTPEVCAGETKARPVHYPIMSALLISFPYLKWHNVATTILLQVN